MNRETQFMGRLGAPVRKYNACSQFNMGYLVKLRRVRPVKGMPRWLAVGCSCRQGWQLFCYQSCTYYSNPRT